MRVLNTRDRDGARHTFYRGGYLGNGGTGTVFYVTKKDGDVSNFVAKKGLAMGELNIMRSIPPHQNVIAEHSTTQAIFKHCIMERGLTALDKFFTKLQKADLPKEEKEKIAVKIILDVLSGSRHLQDNNIMHNDSNSFNWVLGMDGHVKAIDFGKSTRRKNPPLSKADCYYTGNPISMIERFLADLKLDKGNTNIDKITSELDKAKVLDHNIARSFFSSRKEQLEKQSAIIDGIIADNKEFAATPKEMLSFYNS